MSQSSHVRVLLCITAIALGIAPGMPGADQDVSFSKQIQPILEARCVKCHGAATQLGNLNLEGRETALKGGDKGPSLEPGSAANSLLYRRIAGIEAPRMPMGGKLSDSEIDLIRRWIDQGAAWESAGKESAEKASAAGARYWAFRRFGRPAIPRCSDPGWSEHPIDAFLRRAMDDRELTPAPEADRRTLARRAYLDLTGLPPSPAEVAEFLDDQSPNAWENLIERLLASPHYGERWGRHWLDVARYADSNGYEHDFDRPHAWRYRDYVVRAFNKDTPFNIFLQEQIAGDELDWVSNETLIATGFLRNYAKVGFREKDNPQFRFDYLDDMIATIGRGILGLTVQCARCHDHKFDPISQKDYYKLQASLFGYVEVDHPLVPRGEAEEYRAKIAEIDARIAPLREKIRDLEKPYRDRLLPERYARFPQNVQQAIQTPEHLRTPGQILLANQVLRTVNVSSADVERIMREDDLALKRKLQEEIREIESARPPPIPVAMGITDGDYRLAPLGPGDDPAPGKGLKQEKIEGTFLSDGTRAYEPPPAFLLVGGAWNQRGPEMKPGFPSVLTEGDPPAELPPSDRRTSGRRRALAEWLTSPEHPLTARVMVNRIWHHHFGRGLVPTLDNFGRTGDNPSHPELLDWLASEFVRRGWSMKQMHRLIMTSRAYRMSSSFAHASNAKHDPENVYLWRFRPQRLEAEVIRDAVLAVSGSLNREFGGPPVFPKLPPSVLKTMSLGVWKQTEDGPNVWRRSVYVYRKRGLPFPFFEVFDMPDQNVTCGRRDVTTVPTQALTLLNNEFVLENAKRFAARIRESAGHDAGATLDLAYEVALGRLPGDEERTLGLEFLRKNSVEDLAHVLLNLNEFLYLR